MSDTMTDTDSTPTTIPRALRCRAYRCVNPMDRNELCGAHRRGLALTAHLSDAVREFLKTSRIPAHTVKNDSGENADNGRTEIQQKVTEAGECFARGLALLVGTQFDADMYWNSEPIHAAHDRWRIGFTWVAAANGRSLELDDENGCDEIECDEIEGQDDD